MKIRLAILLSISTPYYLFFFSQKIFAQRLILPGEEGTPIEIVGPTGAKGSLLDPDKPLTLARIVNMSLPILFTIAGLILFVYFLWGGFKLLTSLGDEQAIAEAKGMMTNALVGFAVVFVAYWISILFSRLFGIQPL